MLPMSARASKGGREGGGRGRYKNAAGETGLPRPLHRATRLVWEVLSPFDKLRVTALPFGLEARHILVTLDFDDRDDVGASLLQPDDTGHGPVLAG